MTELSCEHNDYDDYFDRCPDCGIADLQALKASNIGMDVLSDTASEIVDYIWFNILKHANNYEHTIKVDNGDYVYRDEAQDIFLEVLDIIGSTLNGDD